MTTIDELTVTLQTLLTTKADNLARSTGFIQRQRTLTGSGFAQALVLGGLAVEQPTRKQQQRALSQTGVKMSVQGLEQRFTPVSVTFMRALLEEALNELIGSEVEAGILASFNGVYLTDCSRFCWGVLGFKLALRWELQRGQLQISLEDVNRHDQKSQIVDLPMAAGALHIGDLGFFKLKRFAEWNATDIKWVSRFKVGTRVYTLAGQPVDVAAWAASCAEPTAMAVQLGTRDKVRCYLHVAPVPADELPKRLARLKEEARLDMKPLSQQRQALAGYTLYITNIPELTFEQAHILIRTRWQIELLFKLWKSHLHVLTSRTQDPIRQQCEGYAKLLGALIQHWVLLVSGWQLQAVCPLEALRIVRTHIPLMIRAFRVPDFWLLFFDGICQDLLLSPPRAKRRQRPAAHQLWELFYA
jgi:hypothetical protein